MVNISVSQLKSLETVSALIQQFNEFDKIFSPVFLYYNGKTEIITLQYRLKTLKSFMNRSEFLENLLIQYLKNPIQIHSDLFSVEINDHKSTQNLALNHKFFQKIRGFNLFMVSELCELDSEYIDIIIDSKFKLNLNSLISTHISDQPKLIEKNVKKYELMATLKTNQFPNEFQCIDVPLNYELILNDFIEYFINRKFLNADRQYLKMEATGKGDSRKKGEYYRMIMNKYSITPLEFNRRIQIILAEILLYIQINYSKIITIDNLKGELIPKIPKGYHRIEETGILAIIYKFKTRFDNKNCVSHSFLTFKFNWMKKIFKKHLPEKKTF